MSKGKRSGDEITGTAAAVQDKGTTNALSDVSRIEHYEETVAAPSPAPQATTPATNPVPRKEETKSQRFRRLANRRLGATVLAAKRLLPLANKSQYEWGPEERDVLIGTISDLLKMVTNAFSQGQIAPERASYFR